MRAFGLFSILAALTQLSGCRSGSARPDAGGPVLPEVRVASDGGPYLFSYYGTDGKLHDADRLTSVPEGSRRQVLIRDLSRSPAELQSDRYLFLADLRSAAPEGGYTTSIVSRYQFDALGDTSAESGGDEDGGERQVVVYGTSWCGACKAARSHLKERHIPYVEKDIEKDQAAAQELARKAKRAGMKLGGVPVIDVAGELLMGYDASTIDRLWAAAQK